MTKIYKINGVEISPIEKLPYSGACLMHEDMIIKQFNQLLEVLSDKEEGMKIYYRNSPETNWEELEHTNGKIHPKEEPKEEPKQEKVCSKCNWSNLHLKDGVCANCREKQEECKHDGECYKDNGYSKISPFGYCRKTPEQSTSLKEEVRKLVKECVYVGELSSEKISDKILSLIQSHLVKEIDEIEDVLNDFRDGNWIRVKDIIKIINNIK